MTTIPTALRFARIGLVASLLGAGLLIAAAQPGTAGELAATPVSTAPAQMQGAGAEDPATTPAAAPAGTVGFGWG